MAIVEGSTPLALPGGVATPILRRRRQHPTSYMGGTETPVIGHSKRLRPLRTAFHRHDDQRAYAQSQSLAHEGTNDIL